MEDDAKGSLSAFPSQLEVSNVNSCGPPVGFSGSMPRAGRFRWTVPQSYAGPPSVLPALLPIYGLLLDGTRHFRGQIVANKHKDPTSICLMVSSLPSLPQNRREQPHRRVRVERGGISGYMGTGAVA